MDKYNSVLQYLYSQLPMYQRQGPKAFKKDLTNILEMDRLLGHPHKRFPAIHVAGTNGKGSTCHMLAAIFTSAGYKTGLYTSPHFRDFRERIRIDGKLMDKNAVVDFVDTHKDDIERVKASFFEISVAMAFWYFAREKVDIAIIETGLGGRLDSTNIIIPELSVITNIGWDHMNFLGDTLPLIAGEKAGIIKPGVPVVISETHPETAPVFKKKAKECKAIITFADQHFKSEKVRVLKKSTVYRVFRDGKVYDDHLNLCAQGDYQEKNLCGVLQAVEVLRESGKWKLPDQAVKKGLRYLKTKSGFIGRWQLLSDHPKVICDSAHNEPGLEQAMRQLEGVQRKNLHMVVGFVNDKELDKLLSLLPRDAKYYFVKPEIPRGLDDRELEKLARRYGITGVVAGSVNQGLELAKRKAGPDDLIYVGGSCFVVAEVV